MGIGLSAWLLAYVAGVLPATIGVHGSAALPSIRAVLAESRTAQTVSGDLQWLAGGHALGKTSGNVEVKVAAGGATVRIGKRAYEAERLIAEPQGSGPVQYGGHGYRGRLEFFRGKQGGVVVLNVLPLEDYLLGVVPSEMPSRWPDEALRAQAVAARTYAIARMANQQDATYDVYNTQADQVYRGMAGESDAASRAVRDTAGQILTYNGVPITAYFYSDAGGYTKNGKEPYLKAVPSRSADSPHNAWEVSLSGDDLAGLATTMGTPVGAVARVESENDPVSGHLAAIVIEGDRGVCRISGPKLRSLLGLDRMKSTLARVCGGEAPPVPGASQIEASATPVGAASVPTSDIAVAQAPVPEPSRMYSWYRPWVAWDSGVNDLKMRRLVATDGDAFSSCNREVFVISGEDSEASAQPPSSSDEGTSASVRLAGLPGITAEAAVGQGGIVIRGSGYGHGLGMPQYGAKQLAQEGWRYRDILLYFYSGVKLVNWDGSLAAPTPPSEDTSDFYKPFRARGQQ
jgi:stage II sporulation protein D